MCTSYKNYYKLFFYHYNCLIQNETNFSNKKNKKLFLMNYHKEICILQIIRVNIKQFFEKYTQIINKLSKILCNY